MSRDQTQQRVPKLEPHQPAGIDLFDVLEAALSTNEQASSDEIAAYLAELDNVDMDPDQKAELINTLWQIVQSLVQIRFGLDPTLDVIIEREITGSITTASMIKSSSAKTAAFGATARGKGERIET